MIMKRRDARETAFALIYEAGFIAENEETTPDQVVELAQHCRELEVDDYVRSVLAGVKEHMAVLDEKIAGSVVGWKMERLSRVSQAIMRLAIYEMLYREDVSYNIAINEAVELAKKYDHDKAPGFINGVLNSVATKEGLKEQA